MLLSDWYSARLEKRKQATEEVAKAGVLEKGFEIGFKKGFEIGFEKGKTEVYRLIAAWNERRKAAEARGEPFTEPPPGITQNGSEK